MNEVLITGFSCFYINFLTHESYIFSPLREEIETFIKRSIVSDKFYSDFIRELWSCHLCQNFTISIILSQLFNFNTYVIFAAPIVALIISIWIKKNTT